MKRIFLDTNFLLDYFVREDYNGDTERVLQIGTQRKMKFFISYLSVANFAYIMRKMESDKLNSIIHRICTTLNVVRNTGDQILLNLKTPFKDFEDGLQYQAALEANCDCIITRNQKDFSASSIPVMSAKEFITVVL